MAVELQGSVSKSGKTTISTVAGIELSTLGKPAIPVDYDWTEFATVDEMDKAGARISDVDLLSYVNDVRARNALSSARAKAIATLTTEVQNSPEYKRSEFIKAAVAFGMSQEQAEQLAASKV